MTTTHVDTFPVDLATASPEDEQLLLRWCVVHLADCEKWLSRRGLGGFGNPALTAARRDFGAQQRHAAGLGEAVQEFAARRGTVPAQDPPADEALADLVERLRRDLYLYRNSLAQGGINRLRVVPVEHSVTPLFLVQTSELFYPRWLLPAVPRELFTTSAEFPSQRPASTSWVMFQTPVLAVRDRVATVAHSLDILEYDYP